MKFLLIALNLLLVAAIGHLAWTFSSKPMESPSQTPTVEHVKVDKKKANVTLTPAQKSLQESPAVVEQKIAAMVERNIFNTERVPDSPANRSNRNAQQQIRAEMRLVGTFTVGDSIGAIILQRLQGNSQQQLRALQQKEYEQYQTSVTRVTDPKKKSAADEKDAEPEADGEETDPEKKTFTAGNATISANNVFRQYLKVGDTTVTGYQLVEVTMTTAVLTKNTERIELTLLSPSEANTFARQQNNNNNNRNNNNNNRNNNNNNNDNNRNQQANNNNRNQQNNNRNQQANNNNRNQQNNNRNNNNRR